MFLGQYQSAIEAAEELIAGLPEDLLSVQSPPMADWLEGLVPVKQHVLVRFWEMAGRSWRRNCRQIPICTA